jgi:hypothetical protein
MNFHKYQLVFVAKKMDLRKTGGPFIPKNTLATVLVRRRDGRVWVDIHEFGQRHVYAKDLSSRFVS